MIEGFQRLLERHGIPFVIVGGQAVARKVPTATEDIDALVLVDDLDGTVQELAKDPAVKYLDRPTSGMAGGQVRVGGTYVDVDLLSPSSYSGNRPGSEFFDYVARTASKDHFATPPVVWYMRLVVGDTGIYASKVATDLRNGAPLEWLEQARKIARRFGTGETVDSGARFVRRLLDIAGPAAPKAARTLDQ